MQLEYDINLYTTDDIESFLADTADHEDGSIYLENECQNGIVKISMPMWNKLGHPKTAVLLADHSRICIMTR
jgi:adenine-specific DNA methylase